MSIQTLFTEENCLFPEKMKNREEQFYWKRKKVKLPSVPVQRHI